MPRAHPAWSCHRKGAPSCKYKHQHSMATKVKIGSEDKACSAYFTAHVPSIFFPFRSSVLNVLLKAIKNSLHVSYKVRLKTFATGHLSLLSGIQCTYSTEIYPPREPSCVLTHTWKTFCSLHMICITCMSLNHEHLQAV